MHISINLKGERKMITIKNEFLTAKINELGAELVSLKNGENEYIWEGKKEIWPNSCPIMFPICGGLKDDLIAGSHMRPETSYSHNGSGS